MKCTNNDKSHTRRRVSDLFISFLQFTDTGNAKRMCVEEKFYCFRGKGGRRRRGRRRSARMIFRVKNEEMASNGRGGSRPTDT